MPRGFGVGKDPMLNPKARAKASRVVDSLGPVGRNPLIDCDADQVDVASVLEKLREQRCRRAWVLPSAHPDRNPFPAAELDLGSELALRTTLDEIEKMLAAQVVPAVPDPFDGRLPTSIARHGQTNRRRGLRPHGPGGGPDGGDTGGGGGPACAAPSGGATAGPDIYGGAAPK